MSANRPKRRAPKTAFKPGQSGNPNGRPKSRLNALLAEHLGIKANDNGDKWEALLVKRVVLLAATGDKWALEFIWDRLEGKPSQPVDFGEGNAPAIFTLHLGDGAAK